MRFKTRDLLVSIDPNLQIDDALAEKLCVLNTRICIRPTFNPCRFPTLNPCGFPTLDCDFPSFGCRICTFRPPTICACTKLGSQCQARSIVGCIASVFEIEDPSDIVQLREELGEVIQELDRLEKEGLPTQIRSAEDADRAEKALEGALEEIRRQRKNLK